MTTGNIRGYVDLDMTTSIICIASGRLYNSTLPWRAHGRRYFLADSIDAPSCTERPAKTVYGNDVLFILGQQIINSQDKDTGKM